MLLSYTVARITQLICHYRISGEIKPEIEPITEDTVRRMENPGQVEVCKSSSNVNEKK